MPLPGTDKCDQSLRPVDRKSIETLQPDAKRLTLRITIVQGAFLPVPALMGGAVEKVWDALAQRFAAMGHTVTHVSRQHETLPNSETKNGVKCLRIRGFDAPRSVVCLKTLDLIYSWRVKKKLPPADIVVTNTFFLPILLRDDRAGKVYVHVARYPKGQMRLYSRVSRLQTVSNSVAKAIECEVANASIRVKVIPYPAIDALAQEDADKVMETKQKLLLFVGRIHPEKGLDLLLRAMSRISKAELGEWRLAIVGPSESKYGGGGEAYLKKLKAIAEPIADIVNWVGPVFRKSELSSLYRAASIFVYPSVADRGETFGLAPLEAITNGCVPILSDLSCFRDFIEEDVEGLYFDHHSDSCAELLARCVTTLIKDKDLLERFARAGLRKAAGYEVPRIADLYIEDFKSIVNDGKNGSAIGI